MILHYLLTVQLKQDSSDQIISYENSVLEKKYPEFRYLMNEFHDGILFLKFPGKRSGIKSVMIRQGLHRYYEEHKNKYLSQERN